MKKKLTIFRPKDMTRKYKICIHDYVRDVNMVMELGRTENFNEIICLFGYTKSYLDTATQHYTKNHDDCTQLVYIWEG